MDHGVTRGDRWVDTDMFPVRFAVDELVLVFDVVLGDAALANLGNDADQQGGTVAPFHGV